MVMLRVEVPLKLIRTQQLGYKEHSYSGYYPSLSNWRREFNSRMFRIYMIIKTVKRGFVMRYMDEEFWDEELYLIPKGAELFDSDCVPYYVDYGDGEPLQETYAHYASYDYNTYQLGEPYEETVKYLNGAALERKAQMLDQQKNEDELLSYFDRRAKRIKESLSKKQTR